MTASAFSELIKETRMGTPGSINSDREVRKIDMSDFQYRKAEIAEELWDAALEVGFFQLVNHGISPQRVDQAFATSARLFALPEALKAKYPHSKTNNVGWENMAQIRPSIGTPDQKESYQITRPHMAGLWPSEQELAGFRDEMLEFEGLCWNVAMQVLSCFAIKLGFDDAFFTRVHDPAKPEYQSTLRLLHYHPMTPQQLRAAGLWRGGAHTDFDCLTLLFQRAGQGGLEVCPGKEMEGKAWTAVEPDESAITCNIGDMLMRWSDDQLPSNFHRVRNPEPDGNLGSRYSIAFFSQANRDAVIQGPQQKYAPITAGEYLRQRVAANFKMIQRIAQPPHTGNT